MTCFDVGDKFSIQSVPSQQKKGDFSDSLPEFPRSGPRSLARVENLSL